MLGVTRRWNRAGCIWLAWGMVSAAGSSARAQTTRIIFEVSQDATNWASFALFQPETIYYVRMRVRLEGATALGLAGLISMPTLSGWETQSGDVRLPFTFPGLDSNGAPVSEPAYSGRHVSRVPGTNTGRMLRFGAAGQSDTSSSGLLTSFVDPGNVLRFAGSRASDPVATPNWGVSISQIHGSLLQTTYDSSLDTVVFRYAIRTGFTTHVGEMVVGLTQLVGSQVSWYLNLGGTSRLVTLDPIVENARIVIPARGSIGTMTIAGVFALRRRRATVRMSTQ